MAIGRISGSVLKSNLTRNGVDLAFETNLLYLDVTNSRVGIGTSEPSTALQVAGTVTATAFAGDGSNLTGINVDTNIQLVGDDSTGATLGTGETFKIAGGTNITTAVSGDTLTVTGSKNINVNSISSDDSSAIQINDAINVSGDITTAGTVVMDRLSLTSSQTTVPPLRLTANSLQDGVGALRIDGSQADIFLNPSTATHTTVTFAVNDDQRLAFGMDNNSDFYITRRTGGTWYDDTFVLDRDTGLLSLGYGATVAGTLTYGTLNDGTTALTSTVAELNLLDGVTGPLVTEAATQTLTNKSISLTNNTLSGTTAEFNTALSDGSFATLAGTETLTNKTLTTPIISSISNTGTLTLPTSTDTLIGRGTTDTLTNKTLTSAVLNTGVSGTAILDEDNMASDSATQLATQQSIKAYVDAEVGAVSTSSISQGNSNVTVTDSGTATIGITTDGTNIINFSTALAIDASNSNTAFRLPGGTTGQRPAGAVGMIRYNSSTDKIEGYTTAEGWAEFGAGASSSSDESGDSVIGIGPNPKNITTFTTGTYDSAFFYAILRDESNDEVSTARYSLVHNDTGAFVATSHVNESDTANDYMTVDADVTDGVVRLRGTGTSNINSVSYYEIPLGDNTEAGTTGNVTKFINTDVDSASEVIDSFALSSIRGAKYFISTKDDVSGEVSNTEAIVVHDGSTAYITQYGSVNATDNNRDLLTLTVEVDSTVVLVKASSSIANVRVTGYRIALGDSESADTGDNINVVAATTVNSGATAIDTFASDVYTGAFYVVVGYNSTEGAASISEVSLVTNGGVSYVSTGPVLSTKGTDQLSFTTGVSGTTVTLNAASTSGSSTTVNAYRVHMLRGIGGAVADTVTVSEDETISGIKTFTAPLTLTVGSDPSTVANNAHIYAKDESSSAEVFVRDEAGNVTKISPHNEQGEWEYYSRNTKTGKTVRVNMEEMIRDIEKLTGKSYIKND